MTIIFSKKKLHFLGILFVFEKYINYSLRVKILASAKFQTFILIALLQLRKLL